MVVLDQNDCNRMLVSSLLSCILSSLCLFAEIKSINKYIYTHYSGLHVMK